MIGVSQVHYHLLIRTSCLNQGLRSAPSGAVHCLQKTESLGGLWVGSDNAFLSLQDLGVNSLEQLCINFANERLQHFFSQTVIAQEEVSDAHTCR